MSAVAGAGCSRQRPSVFPESDPPFLAETLESFGTLSKPIQMAPGIDDRTRMLMEWLRRQKAAIEALISDRALFHFLEDCFRTRRIGLCRVALRRLDQVGCG